MRHSEATLLGHLSDADSLDALAREGFLTEQVQLIIPTEFVRRMTVWALNQFFVDGRQVPPSRQAIMETWADTLERFEVTLPEVDIEIDTIGWVISDLRSNYSRIQGEKLGTEFAEAMGKADGPERAEIFADYAEHFYVVAQSLISRTNEMDGYSGVRDSMARLVDRINNGHQNRGMYLGVDLIDRHTFGVHPGEICTVCSESGVGKSWMAGLCCLTEWRRKRRVLYVTLENDIEMSYDRLACMATGIPYEAFQAGAVAEEQLRALFHLMDEMEASENRPLLTQIDISQRTASSIVRKAQLEGADSLIIDQLSFMRPERGSKATQRNFQVSEIMQRLKELISHSTTNIPVLLLAQINREGAKTARKEGRYRKDHLGDSAWVEQTSDFLWALYRSSQMEVDGTVQFQSLKSRRVEPKHFEAFWQPWMGVVRGIGEIDISRQENGLQHAAA